MSPSEASIHVRVRFDGHTFVPESPVDVPQGIVLELWGEPAERPSPKAPPRPQFGNAKGQIQMRDDFDDPIEGFEEYT